jgi:hypothetical protein
MLEVFDVVPGAAAAAFGWTFALAEQPRTVTLLGTVDRATMNGVDVRLRDFLSLP